MDVYGIPENRIFSSRDTTFGPAIREATGGKGVDVVINSLAGEILRETWDSIAHFGRFIEIGKRDITSNTRLEMSKFNFNATFSSVDLTVLATERPQHMASTFREVMKLFEQRSLQPIAPITPFGISEVETAFRLLQSGKDDRQARRGAPARRAGQGHAPLKTGSELLRRDATYMIIGGTGGPRPIHVGVDGWEGRQEHCPALPQRPRRRQGCGARPQYEEIRRSQHHREGLRRGRCQSMTRVVDECAQQLPPIAGVVHSGTGATSAVSAPERTNERDLC